MIGMKPGKKKTTDSRQVHTTVPAGMMERIEHYVLVEGDFMNFADFARQAFKWFLNELDTKEFREYEVSRSERPQPPQESE